MRLLSMWAALSLGVTSIFGCATSADPTDELAGENAGDDPIDGKADAAIDGAYSYFAVTHDLRRCASPACGGQFLQRLNRSTTICHDQSAAQSCYTPVLDWSEAQLSEPLQGKLLDSATTAASAPGVRAIVRGRFAPTNTTPQPELGRFVVTEAWVAEGDAVSDGVFVRVKQAGIQCIATPCEDKLERALNTSRYAYIAEVDYGPAALSDREIEGFAQATATPEGILIAGSRYWMYDQGRSARGRTATAAFHRLVDVAAQ